MTVDVYTIKITYADCGGKIWRTAQIPPQYTLAEVGYMVQAAFGMLAEHLFEMSRKNKVWTFDAEDAEYLPEGMKHGYLTGQKFSTLRLKVGDTITMVYDMGSCHTFEIEVAAITPTAASKTASLPKITDGAGPEIIEDVPPAEIYEAIKRYEASGSTGLCEPFSGEEWKPKEWSAQELKGVLKSVIRRIKAAYED